MKMMEQTDFISGIMRLGFIEYFENEDPSFCKQIDDIKTYLHISTREGMKSAPVTVWFVQVSEDGKYIKGLENIGGFNKNPPYFSFEDTLSKLTPNNKIEDES